LELLLAKDVPNLSLLLPLSRGLSQPIVVMRKKKFIIKTKKTKDGLEGFGMLKPQFTMQHNKLLTH